MLLIIIQGFKAYLDVLSNRGIIGRKTLSFQKAVKGILKIALLSEFNTTVVESDGLIFNFFCIGCNACSHHWKKANGIISFYIVISIILALQQFPFPNPSDDSFCFSCPVHWYIQLHLFLLILSIP